MNVSQSAGVSINAAHMSEKTFKRFSAYIHEHYGIKLPPTKLIMLESRLRKRLRDLNIFSFEAYADYVFDEGNTDEMINMVDVVTTNKTDFFREPHHFEVMTKTALPDLLQRHAGTNRPLQVWSAACSTGEEPYTLAMVLSEFSETRPDYTFNILASDLSTQVLHQAHRAVYTEAKVAPVPMPLRKKYLLRSKDHTAQRVRIVPALRHRVAFKRLNFLEDDYPSRHPFDIIFCRNVFIYFDRPTQEAIVNKMCAVMRPGSYLFIGHSETLNGMNLPLKQVVSTVYQKI